MRQSITQLCLPTLVVLMGLTVLANPAFAQEPESGNKKEIEIPKAENMTLTTKDNVELKATYLKAVMPSDSPEVGKRTIPFILLHGWLSDRSSLNIFAEQLQKAGCAVIVPDLRGHGESIGSADPKRALDPKKFRKADFLNMELDIEACKKFLVQKNNAGDLNIDLLTVVAMDQLGVAAMNWTLNDWYKFPPISASGIKQGQDVKALVLVSPTRKMGAINLNEALKHPMFSGRQPRIPNLPTFLAWAESDPYGKDCESIYESMAKGRPEIKKIENEEEGADQETLLKVKIPAVDFSGATLLNENPSLRIEIMKFVADKVGLNRDAHPWKSRAPKKEE